MTTTIEYALMAGASYISTRADINQFPVPDGWLERVDKRQVLPSGFEATYFTKGNEIVISFAGTGPEILNPDWLGNFAVDLGVGSQQLMDAAAYYMQVRSLNPDAAIALTGH